MFSKFFIDRPIFATVVSLIFVLAGLVSMKVLPVEQYPNIVPTEIQISAVYPGATAEVLADTVAAPIEQEINGVKNMIYMYSSATSQGYLTIGVVFEIGTDPDQATIDVNNKVQMAMSKLPAEVTKQGVTVEQKSNSILQVVMMKSDSERYDTIYVSNYALLNVLDEVRRIKGVGSATLFASQDYSMRIMLSPDKLADYDMTPEDVIAAVQEQNSQFAAGQFGQEPLDEYLPYTYSVNTKGRLVDEKEFGDIILKSDADLRDVARIELGAQDYSVNAYYNGDKAVAFAVYLQPGANALETANLVKAKLAELSKDFPEGISYAIPYDTTLFVNVSIEEVIHTFFEAVLLVIVVVYLFLQNMRATLIPVLAVPVSIVGAFAGMYLLGFSINLLTLFGLILAIGIVVDDAIIVLENVERLMDEKKLSPREAAVQAMVEVSGPVVAVALVLSSVFLPIAFLGGMTGVMYKQFSVTIAVSVLISAFVALTLTPALCALIIKPNRKREEPKGFFKWFDNFFDWVTGAYLSGVRFFLAHRKTAALLFVSVLVFIALLFKVVPGGLVPNEDQGNLLMAYSMPEASSLKRTTNFSNSVVKLLDENPNVTDVLTVNGFNMLSASQNTYSGISFIILMFCLIYSFMIVQQTTSKIVNKFFPDNVFGDVSPMHHNATAATKAVKDLAMKPVKWAGDVATYQGTKLIGRTVRRIVNSAKSSSRGGGDGGSTGRTMQKGGRAIKKGGQALNKVGSALNKTKFGAVIGVPLQAAGKVTQAAGAVVEQGGKIADIQQLQNTILNSPGQLQHRITVKAGMLRVHSPVNRHPVRLRLRG